jgi:hypothetical protein
MSSNSSNSMTGGLVVYEQQLLGAPGRLSSLGRGSNYGVDSDKSVNLAVVCFLHNHVYIYSFRQLVRI